MRKVQAVCSYERVANGYVMHNLTVTTRECHRITLYSDLWDETDAKYPYIYASMTDIIKSILSFLKSNDFYVDNYGSFNAKWYNILFVNTQNGDITEYGYTREITLDKIKKV